MKYTFDKQLIQQETSNLVDTVHELINILQGAPYNYDENDVETNEDQSLKQVNKPPCPAYVFDHYYLNISSHVQSSWYVHHKRIFTHSYIHFYVFVAILRNRVFQNN